MKRFVHTSNSIGIICMFLLLGFSTIAFSQYVTAVKAGGTPNIFTSVKPASGGLGSIYYQWMDSTKGGSWAKAYGNSDNADYQAGTIWDTTYFKRMAYNVCGAVQSQIITVNTWDDGKALRFDDWDQVVISNDTTLNPNYSSFSIEFWVKTHYKGAGPSNYAIVLAKYGSGNYEIAFSSSDSLKFNIADPFSSQVLYSNKSIADDKWHHVAMVRNVANGTFEVYVDGLLTNSATLSVLGDINPTEELYLGSYQNNFPSRITLDELRIWKKALSGSEIRSQMMCELSGGESNLSAYYSFNQGIATGNNYADSIVRDFSNNSNYGRMDDFALIGDSSNWVYGKDSIDILCSVLNGPLSSAIVLDSSITCFGANNGGLSAKVYGGILPYTYRWSTGDSTSSITALSAGTYSLTISAGTETNIDTFVLADPLPLSVSMYSDDASCYSANDGAASASVSGGTPPYYYKWSNGLQYSTNRYLLPGVYILEVSDANNCILYDTVTIKAKVPYKPNILASEDFLCAGDSLTLSIDTTGVDYCWYRLPKKQLWEVVGTYGFSSADVNDHSLAFHPITFEPYIAFGDEDYSDKTTVMKFDGFKWILVGAAGFTAGRAEYQSLAFHPLTGEAYVAYSDDAYSDKTSVMKFNGSNWEAVGSPGFSAGRAEFQSLAFHPVSNEPYVAYQDDYNSERTTVMYFNGTNWTKVGAIGFSPSNAEYQKLAFNPFTNEPYVAFSDKGNSNKSLLMRFDGSNWVNVGSSFSPGSAIYLSLAFHPSTYEPYVAFQDRTSSDRTTVMEYNGSAWITIGTAGFSAGASTFQNLAFHPKTEQPYVAYSDGANSDKTTVMRYDGSSWVKVGNAAFSPGISESQNIVFHPITFEPYVSFLDGNSSDRLSVMKYAYQCDANTSSIKVYEEGSYQLSLTYANGCQVSTDTISVYGDTVPPTVVGRNIDIYLDNNGLASIAVDDVTSAVDDSCGIDTMYLSQYDFDCSMLDSNYVTLYAKDLNNNIDSAGAWIIVNDMVAPSVSAVPITVYLDSLGKVEVNPFELDNGSTDNCAYLTYTLSDSTFDCSNIGLNRLRYTAADSSANSSSVMISITVADSVAPFIKSQSTSINLDANGFASLDFSMMDNGSYDNCQLDTILVSPSTFTCSDIGINLVSITAMDIYSNASTHVDTVFVADIAPPMAIAKDTSIYLAVSGNIVIDSSFVDDASYDNCGPISITLSQSTFDCSNLGPNKIYLNVLDSSNNMAVDSAILTLIDTLPPTAITKKDTVYLNAQGYALVDSSNIDSITSDNCGLLSFQLDRDTLWCSNLGAQAINYTLSDFSANISTGSEIIHVMDTIAPSAILKDSTVYLDANGSVSIDSSYINLSSNDNCAIKNIQLSKSTFNCADIGQNIVQVSLLDFSGNRKDTSVNITVLDTLYPIAVAKDTLIYLDATGSFVIDSSYVNLSSSDNCGISSIGIDKSNFSCAEIGANQLIMSVRDNSGHISYDTVQVHVRDSIKPIVQLKSLTIYLDQAGFALVDSSDIDSASYDNCQITDFVVLTDSFDCSMLGNQSLAYTVSDSSYNQRMGSTMITVVDSIPPLAMLKDTSVFLNANGNVSIDSSFIIGTSIDNCAIQSVSLSKSNFSCLDVGLNKIQVILKDASQNTTDTSVNIMVYDSIPPQAITKDTVLYLDQNAQIAIDSSFVNNNSTDNCTIQSIVLNKTSFSCSDTGINIVRMIVKDIYNNEDTAFARVELRDSIPPTIQAHTIISTYLGPNSTASIDSSDVNISSFDNCGIYSMSLDQHTFDCSDLDTNLILFAVTDVNFNVSTKLIKVVVKDSLPPTILNCPSTILANTDSASCMAMLSWTPPTAVDSCGIDSIVSNYQQNDYFPIGTTVVTYIAYDLNGNTDSCSFQIIVSDKEAPHFTNCPQDIRISTDPGSCEATVNWLEPTAMDNCKLDSVVSNYNPNTVFGLGVHEVRYIAYDSSMNVDTCSFTITVVDSIAPVLSCLRDTVICDSQYFYALPTYTENCNSSVNLTQIAGLSSGSIFPIGSTENIFVAVDNVGNSDTCSFMVSVLQQPSKSVAGLDRQVCTDTVRLNANSPSIGSGIWSVLNGNAQFIDPADPKTVVNNLSVGLNELIWSISNASCDTSRDTLSIIRNAIPTGINAGNDTVLCSLFELQLNASAIGNYTSEWKVLSGSAVVSDPLVDDPLVSNLDTGNNLLSWTVSNGACDTIRDSILIYVSKAPTVYAGKDRQVYEGDTVHLFAVVDMPVVEYRWSPVFDLDDANIPNPILKANETSSFTIEVISSDSCTSLDELTIFVNQFLEIASGLSPNNDGKNDDWIIKNIHKFPAAEIYVYSRNGQKVFSSTGYEIPWNGTFEGRELPTDSYYYIIKLNDDANRIFEGTVTIIR